MHIEDLLFSVKGKIIAERNSNLGSCTRAWYGSFENEALENEDRSTKHPSLENEAPKSRKRSTLDRKRSILKLENEDPQNSKTKHPKTRHRSVLYKHETNVTTAEIKRHNESNAVQIYSSCKCISAAAWEARWEAMFWT